MKSENQDYVKCKYCKQRIHQCQMYAHKLECNSSNHPNQQSETQSRIKENTSQFQQSNYPQQQSRVQQSSLRQPVQFVESHISSSQQQSNFNQNQTMNNPRSSNYPEYKNASEIQNRHQQNIGQYNESLLKKAQKKCEYCDQEYPTEIIEEHYPQCDTKKLIEQLSIEEDQNEHIHEEYNNHHYHQQQLDNQNHIPFNQPLNRNQNQITITNFQSLPDGTIRQTIITKNQDTGQVISQRIIIQSQSQQQQQYQQQQQQQQQYQQSQQQQINQFPILNIGRNLSQRNTLQSFFDQLFQNSYLNQPRRGFYFIPMMNHLHQAPQGLENLAIIKYVPYDGLSQEYKQCAICINNYEDGEELILLPCIHRFHKKCISEWFKEQSTCPICKTDVTQQEMAFEEDDQL